MELIKTADIGLRDDNAPIHSHAYAELFISLGGTAVNNINGAYTDTGPLDVYVLTDDVVHAQLRTVNYRYCIFKFNMNVLLERCGDMLADKTFHSIFVREPSLRRQGAKIVNMRIDKDVAEFAEKTAVILGSENDPELRDTLFLSLVMLLTKRAKPRDLGECDEEYGRIASIASYIDAHCDEDMSLEVLAEMASYSRRHFTRLFRKYYGSSVMEYVRERRLMHSCEVLLSETASISDIALMCGFSTISAFSRCFKQKYGVSPTDYRKNKLISGRENSLLGGAILE